MHFDLMNIRLMVKDVAASVRFYRDVVGLELAFGEETDSYVEFKSGTAQLALFALDEMSRVMGTLEKPASAETQDRVLLNVDVKDVDAVYETLRERGVEFALPPTDRPEWGLRTAHFYDPDGHLIEIWHAIPMLDE